MTLTQFLIIMGSIGGGLIIAGIILHRSMLKEIKQLNDYLRGMYDKS